MHRKILHDCCSSLGRPGAKKQAGRGWHRHFRQAFSVKFWLPPFLFDSGQSSHVYFLSSILHVGESFSIIHRARRRSMHVVLMMSGILQSSRMALFRTLCMTLIFNIVRRQRNWNALRARTSFALMLPPNFRNPNEGFRNPRNSSYLINSTEEIAIGT